MSPSPRTAERAPRLGDLLDALETFYGAQSGRTPTDPYLFLIWWHCGYPPSEERCHLGWKSLQASVGVNPDELIAARGATLERALKAGGMVPAARAARLKSIARAVRDEFAGDLRGALGRLTLAAAHRLLRRFPGIGTPGADRILLFAALAPVAAVPSACPHVLTRIGSGSEPKRYPDAYREAQQMLEALEPSVAARRRAYLLIRRHGQELCKRTNPRCADCPIAAGCAYAGKRLRPRGSRRASMH